MSVCTTCLQPGLAADGQHDCPGVGEIQVSRHRGRGVVVDHAPARALIGLRIIRDLAWPANIAEVGDPDLVNIADQVLYRVVGYDAGHASLIVELVEDWRADSHSSTGDGICTATIKTYGAPTVRCAQAAGHYDGNKQPDYLTDGGPGGWHRSASDADGNTMTWADWASDTTPHETSRVGQANPPVQCWHYEPGSPCDWDVCRQPERLAAGDRGVDPARKEQP